MSGLYKTILEGEARIGAKVFGSSGMQGIKFYCLDENTWVLRQGPVNVFYRINPSSVYKSNDMTSWRLVGESEAKRLLDAAKAYKNLVEAKVYDSLLALR
ncbi:MAG TPA: hypothetical protein VFX79_02005 [Candidatus Saccharimonadales bacterium]|nr:hypothetical protein [Candidatus Saccharimonadales bacterium]